VAQRRASTTAAAAATFSRWTACKLSHPSVTDELVNEKEKYKNIADEMDQAFSELSGF